MAAWLHSQDATVQFAGLLEVLDQKRYLTETVQHFESEGY
jgi:hypothetical protein